MFAPAYSPHDANTLFLAVDMSEALRTTDGGASWTTLPSDQLQARQGTEVQFTATPGVLFSQDARRTATEATLVRPVKSTDNGDTWLPFANWPAALRAQSVHSNPLRSDTFLVCTGSQLRFYRSSALDGTFSVAHTFAGSQGRVAGVFWQSGAQEECWVATNEGLLYSSNGGQSFSASVAPPTANQMASFAGGCDPLTGQIRFHAITTTTTLTGLATPQSYTSGTNRIWRLDWGAQAWVEVTGALTGNEHPTLVVMARNNADIAYVATNRTNSYPNNCAVWRITAPGPDWTNIFLTAANANIATGWASFNNRATSGSRQLESAISYAAPCGLAVHPTQADRLVFCDNAVIHQCVNASGTAPTWQQIYCVADNPGHAPGELFPSGQSYLSNGLEATVWLQLDWVGGSTILAACLDVKAPISSDNGQRWGFPYDHSTLAGGDINSVTHDPLTGRRYAAAANTVSAYDYLGCDDAHTDLASSPSSPAHGVYYQDPGETLWHPLKTDFGVAAGQRGASPMWLTFDAAARKLYVSILSSDPAKDGIYVLDLASSAWSKLPAPTRNGAAVQHPFNVCVLPGGALVATYCAHQVGDASISPPTLTNGAYKPTSGVFLLPAGAAAWIDRTRTEMRYFTRDLCVDPHDPSGQTWFACVWNTDSNMVSPADATATPSGWGGLYRTTDAGQNWTRIFSGDATFSASATSCTIHPEAALKDELLLTTRFGGLWITQDAHAAMPSFSRVASYRFRAPVRVYYDPANHDKIWVTSNGNGLLEGVRPTGFGEWRLRRFGQQAANEAMAGPLSDPDGDGRINALEYALQSDALAPDPAPLTLAADGLLSFQRYAAASDATFSLEGSTDLESWQLLAQAAGMGPWGSLAPGLALAEDANGTVSVRDNVAADRYFYRLRVDVP